MHEVPIIGQNGGMERTMTVSIPRNHMLFLEAAAHEMGRSPRELASYILIGQLTAWADQAILAEMVVKATMGVRDG